MPCNDFVSFSPEFQPRHLIKPAFLQGKKVEVNANVNVLPRLQLKHLALKGVHDDQTALADAMDASQVGESKSLSLDSHSALVRPGHCAFRRLLSVIAKLEVLSVCGPGPVSSPFFLIDDNDNDNGNDNWCGVERKGLAWEFAKASVCKGG